MTSPPRRFINSIRITRISQKLVHFLQFVVVAAAAAFQWVLCSSHQSKLLQRIQFGLLSTATLYTAGCNSYSIYRWMQQLYYQQVPRLDSVVWWSGLQQQWLHCELVLIFWQGIQWSHWADFSFTITEGSNKVCAYTSRFKLLNVWSFGAEQVQFDLLWQYLPS